MGVEGTGRLLYAAMGFALFIGVFSFRSPFLAARVGIALSLFLFTAPLLPGAFGDGAEEQLLRGGLMLGWQGGVVSLLKGALLGIAVSIGCSIALAAGHWISFSIFPNPRIDTQRRGVGLNPLFLLFAAIVVGGFCEELVVSFVRTVVTDVARGEGQGAVFFLQQGGRALQVALFLALPFFALTLVMDLFALFLERYLRPWYSPRRGVSSIVTVFFLGALSTLTMGGLEEGVERSVKMVLRWESFF